MMKTQTSRRLLAEAKEVVVGGVNNPVRAFKAVRGDPLFIARGVGPCVWDADGNSYVDCVCSWGPLIFGRANPRVLEAVTKAVTNGAGFGAPSVQELAQKICSALPNIGKMRFVNSRTEATTSAVRLALKEDAS